MGVMGWQRSRLPTEVARRPTRISPCRKGGVHIQTGAAHSRTGCSDRLVRGDSALVVALWLGAMSHCAAGPMTTTKGGSNSIAQGSAVLSARDTNTLCKKGIYVAPGSVRGWLEDSGANPSYPDTWATIIQVHAFCIDRTEVTRADYASCLREGACKNSVHSNAINRYDYDCEVDVNDSARSDHPITCVNFYEAKTFCRWRGGRLPSDAEWYQAARGVAGFVPEIMNDIHGNGLAVAGRFDESADTFPVGSHPADRSDFGVLDMLGSVTEWADSRSYPQPLFQSMPVRQAGWFPKLGSTDKVLILYTRPSPGTAPDLRRPNLGFRCLYTLD